MLWRDCAITVLLHAWWDAWYLHYRELLAGILKVVVPWGGLRCAIVVFADHTHLLFGFLIDTAHMRSSHYAIYARS